MTCDNEPLREHAQRELDERITARTAGDVTTVIQRLFDRHADLFRIRDQGGCYFVPAAHMEFVEKVEKFVSVLNGNLRRFPIPAGTPQGDRSVKESVADGLDAPDRTTTARRSRSSARMRPDRTLRAGRREDSPDEVQGRSLRRVPRRRSASGWKPSSPRAPSCSRSGSRRLPSDDAAGVPGRLGGGVGQGRHGRGSRRRNAGARQHRGPDRLQGLEGPPRHGGRRRRPVQPLEVRAPRRCSSARSRVRPSAVSCDPPPTIDPARPRDVRGLSFSPSTRRFAMEVTVVLCRDDWDRHADPVSASTRAEELAERMVAQAGSRRGRQDRRVGRRRRP